MQKKVLALALAGALVAPLAAHAQDSNVQIYGLLLPSIDRIDNGGAKGSSVQSNFSRMGFRGSEDLGNGLRAIFQLESAVDFDERTGGLTSRDSWVGLAGNFGSLTIGNHQSAYVRSTHYLDPLEDTIGDYNNIMSMVRGASGFTTNFNGRYSNSIYYKSPELGGVQVRASYALRGEGFKDAGSNPTISTASPVPGARAPSQPRWPTKSRKTPGCPPMVVCLPITWTAAIRARGSSAARSRCCPRRPFTP